MNKFYTYAYLREDKTPYYVGKGTGDRIYSTHRKGLKPPKDKSRIIFLKKNLTEEEAFEHEIYMVAVFGRKDLGTGILHNKTDGGEGASGAIRSDQHRRKTAEANIGRPVSEETKRKISEANKGRVLSEETKKRMSVAKKGRVVSENQRKKMCGRIVSEETRKKLSDAFRGRIISKESRKKISQAFKGRKWWNDGFGNCKLVLECPGNGWKPGRILSEEHRKKLSEANKGKSLSEEHKQKLSEANKGRTHSEESKMKMSEANKGKKCWNDGCGNIKYMIECPGDDWRLGKK